MSSIKAFKTKSGNVKVDYNSLDNLPDLTKKVDTVPGKGLSTNDLTNELLAKLQAAASAADLKNIIGEASPTSSGLMSADDKSKFEKLKTDVETILNNFTGEDGDDIVNTIKEVLDVFAEYPEEVSLIDTLTGIQDQIADIQSQLNILYDDVTENFVEKEEGKSLSTNDFSNEYKDYIDALKLADAFDAMINGTEQPITVEEANDILESVLDGTN